MCENKCFYLLDLSKAPRAREIIVNGLVKYDLSVGKGMWCDALTPISEESMLKDGSLDLTCYGPDDPRCPGYLEK